MSDGEEQAHGEFLHSSGNGGHRGETTSDESRMGEMDGGGRVNSSGTEINVSYCTDSDALKGSRGG